MSKKKWEIDRRTFLRNSGAAIALPLLNAMAPSVARSQTGKVQRLLHIWHPNGVPTPTKANGDGYKLWIDYTDKMDIHPKLEAKLASVKDYTTYVCGLDNPMARQSNSKLSSDFGKGHAHGVQFICGHNGSRVSKESDMGITFDQSIAYSGLHNGSMHKSLAITLNPGTRSQHPLSQNLLNKLSWRGPNNPLKHYGNPRELFDLLFKGGVNTPNQTGIDQETKNKLLGKRLVLDNIVNEIKSIQKKIGKEDRFTLDKYLTEIEEIDRKTAAIIKDEQGPSTNFTCESGNRPAEYTGSSQNADVFSTKLELFQDIVIKSFQCDLTRVTSMMLGRVAGFGQSFNLPGMKSGQRWKSIPDPKDPTKKITVPGTNGSQNAWHPYQHWYGGKTADYIMDTKITHQNFLLINEFIYQKLANLALKMKNTPTNNGKNLLDETLIVFGSTMSGDAGHHNPCNWHRVLIGSGGGAFKMQQKFRYKTSPFYSIGHNESIFSLWLAVMKGFGVNKASMGGTNKVLNEILA